MKPQGVIPGKDDPPKDKNRRAVGRIIGVSLLPPLCGSNKWYWLPGVTPVGFTPGYYLITPTVFGDNYNAKKVWLIMSKNIAHGFEKSWAMFEKTTGNVFQNHQQCFSKTWATFFSLIYLQMWQPAHLANSPRKRFSTSLCRRSFKASTRIESMTSEVKATLSNMRASSKGMPRLRM